MANPQREPSFIKIIITRDVHEKMAEFKKNWEGTEAREVSIRVEVGEREAHEVTMTLDEFLQRLELGVAAKIIKENVR